MKTNELRKQRRRLDARRETAETRLVADVRATRECGECTACCVTMAIDELDKPAGEPCQHLMQIGEAENPLSCGGCSVYDERPPSCRAWECMWRAGNVIDEDGRPDRIGLVLDMPGTRPGYGTTILERHRVVVARELWPGAADSPKGRALCEAVGERHPVLVLHPNRPGEEPRQKRLVGRPDLVRAMLSDPESVMLRRQAEQRRAIAEEQLEAAVAGVYALVATIEAEKQERQR